MSRKPKYNTPTLFSDAETIKMHEAYARLETEGRKEAQERKKRKSYTYPLISIKIA